MSPAEELRAAADRLEALAKGATPGPWQWWNLEGADQGWSDNGPSLETVARGPVYSDGSQGAAATIIGAWGHDAWGISVEESDAAYIAAMHPGVGLALPSLLRVIADRYESMLDTFAPGSKAGEVTARENVTGFDEALATARAINGSAS